MRIEKLEIESQNIKEQLEFYRDVLELEIEDFGKTFFEVRMGFSMLRFVENPASTPYHIAIHIPDKQEEIARTWIKDKVSLLKSNGEEIIDFSNWNAKSMYFYDADKNIMEFIARRDFNPPGAALFSAKSMLGLAEVGLVTNEIKEKYELLQQHCQLDKFDGNFENFCAIGDDEGLLITINKNEKDWFPTNDTAFISNFTLDFSHKGQRHQINFRDDQLNFSPITK